ncbi:MAG: hypothetical protein ACYTGQ_00810 [Planctomycetota bacterium]|jgi:hypothetical protein
MNYAEIRRLSLNVFLGFLGLTAVIAIVSVLAGEFGEVQAKILGTTLTISAASICSMACAAFIERKKHVRLGLAGIVLSVCAAILLIAGMWPEIDSDEYWKTTLTFAVLAVAFAHAFLLLLPRLDDSRTWVQNVSAASIGLLTTLIVAMVWGEMDNEGYLRFMIVVAIVVGLETLSVPILLKLRTTDGQASDSLNLVKVQDNIYRDASGRTYELREINTED